MDQFIEFDPEDFPVRIEAYDQSGAVVWAVTADSPGGLRIPSLREQFGPVGVRMYCNGELRDEYPPPTEAEIAELQRSHGLTPDGYTLEEGS